MDSRTLVLKSLQAIDKNITASLPDETRFFEDLNFDSLDLVEAIMLLEDEIDTEFSDESLENVYTVGQLIALAQAVEDGTSLSVNGG